MKIEMITKMRDIRIIVNKQHLRKVKNKYETATPLA